MMKMDYVAMFVSHNEHKLYYQTAEQFILESASVKSRFISEEELQKSIDTNEIWGVQIYPDTPIGSYILHASNLVAIFEHMSGNKQ